MIRYDKSCNRTFCPQIKAQVVKIDFWGTKHLFLYITFLGHGMDKTGNDIIVVKLVFEMKDIKAVFQRKLACTRGHYIDMTYHSVATTKKLV